SGTYTPASGTEGSHNIIATYSPDASHGASSSSTSILVSQRTTTATVGCSSNTVPVGSNNQCTATIRDVSLGTSTAPAGGVSFFLDSAASSFGACSSLITVNSTTATCTVTFTPVSGTEGSHG